MKRPPPASLDRLVEQVSNLLLSGGSIGMALGLDEQDYETLYTVGHYFYRQGRYADACKVFSYLVMFDHLERRFLGALAASHQMLKNYKEAIEFYSLSSVMDLDDPVPTFHTGECLLSLGLVTEAREALEMVVLQSNSPRHEKLRQRASRLLELLANVNPEGKAQ